ncbi:MAG: DUF5107 domain-containing protein [Clostridia bacterium]|nr:DUF5107 domain-containing protein [Clostridia bacterium]
MIHFEKIIMPAASMGDVNPMPDISDAGYIHAKYNTTEKVTAEEAKYIGAGRIHTLLPYLIQDGYDRDKKEKEFDVAVLENEYIKAVFIPELGGRLWSIFDKKKGKDLLYVNPVFQPCNLALRNAWFSGGVEFNIGIRGHNPLTCSPLWCAVDKYENGEVLRLWEFERKRGVVYSISAYLPDDSPVLYIKCKIENKEKETKDMYWWSNIAVPEENGTRIVVPASECFLTHYYGDDGYLIDKIPVPIFNSNDISYPINVVNSRDFFYKIPESEYKWIASPDKDGFGLLQCSTEKLFGRKLFVWGMSRGGRHWNEWLSKENSAYVEIQAGLTNTQFELIPMDGGTSWEWIEAYTALDLPKEKVHGEYGKAVDSITEYMLSKVGNPDEMTFPDEKMRISTEIIFKGSDWGALEEMARGEKISDICDFLKSDDEETKIWTNLLETNTFLAPPVTDEPKSYGKGKFWLEKLQKLNNKNWFSYLHEGIIKFELGDKEGAKESFEKSLASKENPWAFSCLSLFFKSMEKDTEKAKEYILSALMLKNDNLSILKEVALQFISYGSDKEWLEIYNDLGAELKENGRLKMYTAIAYLNLDMLKESADIINENFVMSDIREGELSVSHYWFELYRKIYAKETGVSYNPDDKEFCRRADEKYPLPASLDFRMNS